MKCWNTLKTAKMNVIMAFCQLGKTVEVPEEVFEALEEFVCRLYYPRSDVISIDIIRWQMFRNSQAEAEKLPTTRAAFRNNILRAHYQALVWSNDNTARPSLPSPLGYGWNLEGSIYSAVTSTLPSAPSAVVELVKCGCTTSRCRTSACSCRRHELACAELCVCESEDEACENKCSQYTVDESDGDGDVTE